MHFSSVQVLLLAVVTITSTPRLVLGQQATPKICTAADAGKQFCSNCTAPAKCTTLGPDPVLLTACKTGQACTVLLVDRYAVCKPINETSCACGAKPFCDPYDPHSIFICLSGGITVGKQCRTKAVSTGTCIAGKCGIAPPEPTTVSPDVICKDVESGLVAVTPQCVTAAFCEARTNTGTLEPCGAGQYFDVDEFGCLPAPPLPCPVACGTGACYDKGNCSKWYICDAGTVLAEETCEDSTPVFDTFKLECVGKGAGTCTTNDGCNFTPISTLTSTTSTQTTSSTITTTSTTTDTGPPITTTSTKTTTTPPTTTTSTKTTTTPPTTTTSTITSTTPTTSSSTSTTSTSISTTNRPSTCGATNVGLRYPFEGNCKKYMACRLLSTNVYGYVESSCLGTLVFNAKTGYCDTLANVPGCVPPV